jgi:hypothetical protein
MPAVPAPDHFALLEARHVDALTEAVRALTIAISQLTSLAREQLQATRGLNDLLRTMQPTNGTTEHVIDEDVDRDRT